MKHKSTQPLYIFNRENPQNSEQQNGPRRGLDFIALYKYAIQIQISKQKDRDWAIFPPKVGFDKIGFIFLFLKRNLHNAQVIMPAFHKLKRIILHNSPHAIFLRYDKIERSFQ